MTDEALDSSTATLDAARSHARSQAGGADAVAITVPSRDASSLPPSVDPATVIWDEMVPAGNYATRALPRRSVVRITDLDGDATVAMVVHRADHPAERLNVADTVKVQWQAYLGAGTLLLSDMGRSLMTMVTDTSGHHDALCGASTAASTTARFGRAGAWTSTPATRDLLALGLAKHGLGRRDLAPNVNLFSNVTVAEDGRLELAPGGDAGAHVELRADMDVILTLANAPHPLDDRADYTATPIRVTAWMAADGSAEPDDSAERGEPPAEVITPERQRAYDNTAELLAGQGR